MRIRIENRVTSQTQLARVVLASELILPTHVKQTKASEELITDVAHCMRTIVAERPDDFQGFCPGFKLAYEPLPVVVDSADMLAITALTPHPEAVQDQVDLAFEILVLRTNASLPVESPLRIP